MVDSICFRYKSSICESKIQSSADCFDDAVAIFTMHSFTFLHLNRKNLFVIFGCTLSIEQTAGKIKT